MRTANEIRMLRSGRGFFSQRSMATALGEAGIKLTPQAYSLKEKGRVPFSAKEVEAMAKILDISLEQALDFFVKQ